MRPADESPAQLPEELLDPVRVLFAEHGHLGDLFVVDDQLDEAIFVVPAAALPELREPELSTALQALLHRKVWVVADAPVWRAKSRRLDPR